MYLLAPPHHTLEAARERLRLRFIHLRYIPREFSPPPIRNPTPKPFTTRRIRRVVKPGSCLLPGMIIHSTFLWQATRHILISPIGDVDCKNMSLYLYITNTEVQEL